MIFFFVLVGLVYCLLILFLIFGFGKIPNFEAESSSYSNTFSIIIPFRNEAENLPKLFSSLENLRYPIHSYEIILVDDESEDHSLSLCEDFSIKNKDLNIKIYKNNRPELAKKGAIGTGVEASSKNFVLTTDADCEVPKNWLSVFNDFINTTEAKFIAGPVTFKSKKGFLNIFQQIDFLSLQGASIGGFGVEKPFMCNAANLCFEKKAFLDLSGYSGNENIASGDDIFLLEKMRAAGYKTAYLKSKKAIVETLPQENFSALVNQRVRWAAKTSAYNNSFGRFVGICVLLMNFVLIITAFMTLFNQLPQSYFLLLFVFKFNVDFILIYRTSIFFGHEHVLKNYFWCSIFYPFFTCYIGLKALFFSFRWKGRNYKM